MSSTREGSELFRSAALDYLGKRGIGSPLLARPLSANILTAVALSVVSAVVVFICTFSYTQHATVFGVLTSRDAEDALFLDEGTVAAIRVRPGQHVRQGDVLVELLPKGSCRDTRPAPGCAASLVRAKSNSTVTSIGVTVGEHLKPQSFVLATVPDTAALVGEIALPAAVASQVTRDSEVVVEFDTLPRERFGLAKAALSSVSLVPSRALPDSTQPPAPGRARETDAAYSALLNIDLESLSSGAHGQEPRIGSAFRAHVSLGRRRIVEWMFGRQDSLGVPS